MLETEPGRWTSTDVDSSSNIKSIRGRWKWLVSVWRNTRELYELDTTSRLFRLQPFLLLLQLLLLQLFPRQLLLQLCSPPLLFLYLILQLSLLQLLLQLSFLQLFFQLLSPPLQLLLQRFLRLLLLLSNPLLLSLLQLFLQLSSLLLSPSLPSHVLLLIVSTQEVPELKKIKPLSPQRPRPQPQEHCYALLPQRLARIRRLAQKVSPSSDTKPF